MLKRTLLLTLTICAVASLAIPQPAYAQISEFKITAADGAAGDLFGNSVSISGDYAVVGARRDDDNGISSGSAYVYKRTGTSWAQEAKLLASDGAADDLFGWSVSISGDYAVVGARRDDDNGISSGSAYVYKRTGTSWAQEAKLLASDGAADDLFGWSVSISGDYAVVGAFGDDDNGTDAGSAYVFKRTGTSWAQEAKLLASDSGVGDQFGNSVSISGDYAVVGAWLDDDSGSASGSAYLFTRSGTSWAQKAKLLASDGATEGFFGKSVSISGDYAIVGAPAENPGSAYLYYGFTFPQEVAMLSFVVEPVYAVPDSDSLKVNALMASSSGLTLMAAFESVDSVLIDSVYLFDDDAHNDGIAGDSLFGNLWLVPAEERHYLVNIHVSKDDTLIYIRENAARFTTIGPVVLDSYTLFDTIPNPGERLFLELTLRNNGSTANATAITADISTSDTCVTDIGALGQNTYGDIGPGATATSAGAYIVDVNENCAGDQDILFDISIASEGFDFWGDSFTIHVFPTDTTIPQTRWHEKSIDSVDGNFSQGVATDGVDWYFSARQTLFKTNYDYDFLVVNENPIPQFLQDQSYDHIGDIAYFEGKLYAPIEDASYVKPIICLYDAVSLDFTGEFAQVPQSHIPWVAVDPRTGYFYSSEFNGVNNLFVYDPNQNFALIDEVQLDTTLSNVQGGAFLGDFLYLA
ncbi:hypothetical protein E3V55_02505, partial [Candidatus Marinimicrobia bacterium MT.SAG.3]